MDTERIVSVRGAGEESGFVLTVGTDEDDYRFLVPDVATARVLLSEVSRLRSWIAEHDRERAAFDRATPEERGYVIDGPAAGVLEGHDDMLDAADGRS